MKDPTQLAAEAAEQVRGFFDDLANGRGSDTTLHDIIQTAIEKAREADAWTWRQCRELLNDGKPRALCWNCGYPELIGSDDCRNCSTNFDPIPRIVYPILQPTHASEQEALLGSKQCPAPENELGDCSGESLLRGKAQAVTPAPDSRERQLPANGLSASRAAHVSEQGADATAIDKAVREVLNFHPWSYKELYRRMVKMCYALYQRPTPATVSEQGAAADAEYNESWRQWRELLSDGRERALCWNCGYPELIGSDDCRNCSTNFDPSKRIPVQPAHVSEQGAFTQERFSKEYFEMRCKGNDTAALFTKWSDEINTALQQGADTKREVVGGIIIPQHPDPDDTKRLDWLSSQHESHGEGRLKIWFDEKGVSLREAIDAAMSQCTT